MCTTKGERPLDERRKTHEQSNETKQNTEWEPWDKVAIFSSCPQPDLIEEALEEAPDGVELRIRFGQNYGNAFHIIFNKQKEGWKDEHGYGKNNKGPWKTD